MKKRVTAPLQGVYQDFRAVEVGGSEITDSLLHAARASDVQILLRRNQGTTEIREGIVVTNDEKVLPTAAGFEELGAKEQKRFRERFKDYPDEVFAAAAATMPAPVETKFRHKSTHILARELTPAAVTDSIASHRSYGAFDWLCDPAGFYFVAESILGVYDIGDDVPMLAGTHLLVNLPIPGRIQIERDGKVVAEKTDTRWAYAVTEQGSYSVEVVLTIGSEQFPWITTDAIRIGKPELPSPNGAVSAEVDARRDLAYADDGEASHKLDLYLPKGKTNYPVMIFLHGGNWRGGDRAQYPWLGNRFADGGIGVVIPSYRLMPQNPFQAEMEDAAAAFSWVVQHISEFGGDPSRIYVMGHSSGGHLASLLALDPRWLKKYDLSPGTIRGVVSISGIYDVTAVPDLSDQNASPLHYVHPRTPPFLIAYCQWDYFGFPKQARDFAAALQKEFDPVRLLYVAGRNHASEIMGDEALDRAILDFVK